MHHGYVKFYRSLKDSSFYLDSEYVHLWVHLLLSVNHAEKRLKIEKSDKFLTILPGQILTSRKTLTEQTGIHRSKVERILKAFESEQQIEQQTFSKYRVISITKWVEYQCSEQENEQEMGTKRAADEQQVSTNKNEKKGKKESRGAFHPPSLEEVTAYCSERNRGVIPNKWHDFYTSKNWMVGKNKMKDWRAAVRTWEKDEVVAPCPAAVPTSQQALTDQDRDNIHRARERVANE